MPRVLILLLLAMASPSWAAVERRSMPELSDIALFLVAAFALWFVRRSMRRRFRRD
jgi:hypothetical protein